MALWVACGGVGIQDNTQTVQTGQGTMLYASGLTRGGQNNVEGEYQCAINRKARSTLGAFRSTPRGILAAESGLTPARALLGLRQARFA